LPSRRRISAFSSSVKSSAPDRSNKAVTLVSTLFTCCPPLPLLREVWNCTCGNKESGSICRCGTILSHPFPSKRKSAHQQRGHGITGSVQQRRDRVYQGPDYHYRWNGLRRQAIDGDHKHLPDVSTVRNAARHDAHKHGNTQCCQ